MYGSFSGNLGKDSEVIETKSGTKMLKFSVADEVYANGKKETQWINCVDFRKASVEKLVEYLKKGALVHVSGEVSLHSYENKDGVTKITFQCAVNGIRLHGNKNDSGGKTIGTGTGPAASKQIDFDSDDTSF